MGLILIEVTILGIGMVSYFYLRTLAPVWPPSPTALPDLLLPTVNTLLLLVSVVPMYWVDRAARRNAQSTLAVRSSVSLLVFMFCAVSRRGFAHCHLFWLA